MVYLIQSTWDIIFNGMHQNGGDQLRVWLSPDYFDSMGPWEMFQDSSVLYDFSGRLWTVIIFLLTLLFIINYVKSSNNNDIDVWSLDYIFQR